jgi:hypothetical protein
MQVYTENYGADADGNRGQKMTFAELDESDNEAVIEKLYETFIDGTFSGKVEIEIDDFNFDVYIEDYFDELDEKAKQDMGEDYGDIAQDIEDYKLDLLIKKAEKFSKKHTK